MKYKGVIWTNHIIDRMKERDLSYDDVFWAFSKPDEIHKAKIKNASKFYRYYNNNRLAVVAKKNDKGEWVLLTCWIKDMGLHKQYGRKPKKMSFLRYVWYVLTGY